MTDPTGRSFLSYRRSRLEEAKLLVAAQHELGIPTWQDIDNLDEEPTEEALRKILEDEFISNVVLWLTPDVAESPMIQRVEAPMIFERHQRGDRFFVVPVAAGGLSYEGASSVLDGSIGIEKLKSWNIRKTEGDPISQDEARLIARRVLRRRLRALDRNLPEGEPLRIVVNTRQVPAVQAGVALTLDFTHWFDGRSALPNAWAGHLSSALEEVATAIQELAPDRGVVATQRNSDRREGSKRAIASAQRSGQRGSLSKGT